MILLQFPRYFFYVCSFKRYCSPHQTLPITEQMGHHITSLPLLSWWRHAIVLVQRGRHAAHSQSRTSSYTEWHRGRRGRLCNIGKRCHRLSAIDVRTAAAEQIHHMADDGEPMMANRVTPLLSTPVSEIHRRRRWTEYRCHCARTRRWHHLQM